MTPSNLEGITLGKYRILEPLGRGGMAQVYKAYHPQLDRYMAIKILRSDLVENDEFLTRFRQEAHAVSGLRHANIVQVFDFDVQDDYYYMVMELLEGDTLRALLNDYRVRNQRIPLAQVVRIIKDILSGLSYAHAEGITHRDIKPANIMLNKKGTGRAHRFWRRTNPWEYTTHSNRRADGHAQLHGSRTGSER
jgi:serine/threonine protein kinase